MKIYANRLQQHLTQTLLPVYVITGDEPLQVNECSDLVRRAARERGFTDRVLFSVDIDSNRDEFRAAADNLSLFAEKQILDLRLPKGKAGREWAQVLAQYLQTPPPDNLLLISGSRLERGQLSSAWYKKSAQIGAVIGVWPLKPGELLGWIQQRLQKAGLRASRSAVELIAVRVEGNMLAAHQEIEKLALLYPDQQIGDAEVLASVVNSTRYSLFDLSNAAMDGQIKRVVRVLNGLKNEGTEPVLVLWVLSQDIRLAAHLAQLQYQGMPAEAAIKQLRIPANKIKSARSALHRHTEDDWMQMLSACAELDRMVKGHAAGKVWEALFELAFHLAGRKFALAGS